MDLFGPSVVRSYGGNRYTLVIVDDYSRYTWTRFLKDKTEAFDQFEIFSKKIQNQLGCTIVSIRTDHGREFDNEVQFGEFCNANGITHNFSAPRTPQSNGVVERKNRTLQEMSRTMLNEQSLPQKFWCNAVDTSTYILNRILIRAILGKTPYELLRGRKPTLDYFRVFGSKCFILNTKDYLTKFDPKSYEESLNVTFDETPPPSKTSPLVDDDLDEEEAIREIEKKNLENVVEDETLEIDDIVNIKESRNHPLENVIGNLNQRTLRSQAQNQSNFFCFISTIEPKNVNEALGDESWIVAMQEELNQFIANDVWELVPQPRNMTIIGTKWVFRNKLDENGIVSRNKEVTMPRATSLDHQKTRNNIPIISNEFNQPLLNIMENLENGTFMREGLDTSYSRDLLRTHSEDKILMTTIATDYSKAAVSILLRDYRKPRMSVRQVWKRKPSTPKSSPPSQNDSPPLPPRVYLQSPSPPSYNPLRDQTINQLHNISTILDSHPNPSNAYIHAPPSPPPPQIHPPSHAQVEFHLSFCHCCKFSRHQFHSLRNEINFIHYLLTRPIPPTHASPTPSFSLFN
ncbi:retrovirus-related pol polyprotein from transposon TNT 1-94 [Tanacetum coccineum]